MSSETAIRIRMYRIGFGDCFLISFPVDKAGSTDHEWRHVLVDCGVHPAGDIGTMDEVVSNIAEESGGRLALVIATHAHKDHISGFASQEEVFKRFEVGRVWLPWTENPSDPDAAKLREEHAALAEALERHFAAKPDTGPSFGEAMAAVSNLTQNEKALALLKAGINGASVEYVSAGKIAENAAGIDGLSIQVLAPPRDKGFLAKMELPADERLLRAKPGGGLEAVNATTPFDARWIVGKETNTYYEALTERDRNLLAVLATMAEGLAFALDDVLNNTSIVALFTFAGRHLLFAGDAQYGNWKSWIERSETKKLLASVSFYKVSHHGSQNATPKSALEAMSPGGFGAMVSTQSKPWKSIPRPSLIGSLGARASGMVRSDSIAVEGAPAGPPLEPLPEAFKAGRFWVDYFIPIDGPA